MALLQKVSLISGGITEDPAESGIFCNGEQLTSVLTDKGAAAMDTEDDYVYDIFCL